MMNMKLANFPLIILGFLLLITVGYADGGRVQPVEFQAAQVERRCGWLDNPTPGNISLYDRSGEWIIGVQGGYQVETDWDWPDFKPGQWVRRNGNYGYGCVCMQLRVNKQTERVLEIKSSTARPLSACRQDSSLKRWRSMFK